MSMEEIAGTQQAGGALAVMDEILSQKNAVKVEQVTDPIAGTVVPVASVPEGRTLQSLRPLLDEYLPRPLRRKGTASLLTEKDFVRHVDKFRGDTTTIFCDPNPRAPSLTAIYDYHAEGSAENVDGGDAAPGFCQHRATLSLRMSDEWQAWLGVHGKDLDQGAFAAFLQDHIGDLVLVDDGKEPSVSETVEMLQARLGSPQTIMQLSRGIEVRQQFAVKNAVSLENGALQISYVETQTGETGGPLVTPTLFFITIPVFYAGDFYRIPVRIRYRIVSGKLLWSLHLYRHERVFEDAFAGVVKNVEQRTNVPVLLGSVER